VALEQMKNFTRVRSKWGKYDTLRLIDDDGEFLDVMDTFVAALIKRGEASATVDRYSNVVAQFLDYLVEVGVFGQPSSRYEILNAVDWYLAARVARPDALNISSDAEGYFQAVSNLKQKTLSRKSAQNAAAAINRFLELSDYWSTLTNDMADWDGIEVVEGAAPMELFKVLKKSHRSATEIKRMMQKSMLAGVTRWKPNGIDRPKGGMSISSKIGGETSSKDNEMLDYPAEYLMPLLDAANCFRDQAVWSLMAGAGLRTSEAIQLPWEAIDFDNREVFVHDPESHRYADQLPQRYARRFKGRRFSETYIIPQLRDIFFEALENYLRYEHRPITPDRMVFQDIRTLGNGRPYSLVQDNNRIKAFHAAGIRSGAPRKPNGKPYTPHSLRHFYGVFMLNFIPVEGGYGLRLPEVQKLMGHEDSSSTAHYAREDPIILESKLRMIDHFAMGQTDKERDIRAWIAKRHTDIAQRMLSNMPHGDSI
jgi:integrase